MRSIALYATASSGSVTGIDGCRYTISNGIVIVPEQDVVTLLAAGYIRVPEENSQRLIDKLTDETGSGLAVFNDSPLLITPRLSGGGILPKTSGQGIKVDIDSPVFGWRDIIGNVHPKASGVGSPTRAAYSGGNLGQYAFVANDVCDFEFHIPHDYAPGTDIYFHVHWSHNGTSISGNAAFDIYHSYAKGHNQANFPAEKNVTITYPTADISTTPQYRHRIDEVIISGASATATLMDHDDIEVDGLVQATLKLTTLPTIGGGGKLFVHTCDLHYQSTNMATKGRAPDFYA